MNYKSDVNQPILFELGRIVSTPGALAECRGLYLLQCLKRHASGDWGCISDLDKDANTMAVNLGILMPRAQLVIDEGDYPSWSLVKRARVELI